MRNAGQYRQALMSIPVVCIRQIPIVMLRKIVEGGEGKGSVILFGQSSIRTDVWPTLHQSVPNRAIFSNVF